MTTASILLALAAACLLAYALAAWSLPVTIPRIPTRRETDDFVGDICAYTPEGHAMTPDNEIVGGVILRIPAIQSPNFVSGVSGWIIRQDGTAEFHGLTVTGGSFIIDGAGQGMFIYSSSPPAFGTLVQSSTQNAGTDATGNAYLAGDTSYLEAAGVFFACSNAGGVIQFETAPSAAGPYTPSSLISGSAGGMLISTGRLLNISGGSPGGVSFVAPTGDATGAGDVALINGALASFTEVILLNAAGSFTINAPLTPGQIFGQKLRGLGWGTQVHYDGTVLTGAAIQPSAAGVRFTVEDLRLTQSAASSAGTAVDLSLASDCVLRRLLIDGSTNAPVTGIKAVGNAHYYSIENCRVNVSGAGCTGIKLDTNANSVTLINPRILGDANMTGISCDVNGVTIIKPDIESTALVGIAFGAAALNCNVVDGYLQNLTTAITLAAGCGPITITGADLDGSGAGITDAGCVLLSLRGVRDFNGAILNQDRVTTGGADYYAAQDATATKVFQISSAGNVFHRKPAFFASNVAIGGVSSDFGGAGSALLLEHTTDPTTNPAAGHILLYCDAAGNLQARTSAGNVRLIAAV